MYAIFENGSKQYKVSVGDTLKVEKLNAEVGATVKFPVILTADEKGIQVGKEVENVNVSAEVVAQGKGKKIIVFKYKSKKNERKKQGHRQPYTAIKVTAIGASTKKATAKKVEEVAEAEAAAPEKKTEKKTATKTATTKATATKTAAKKPAEEKSATAAKKPAAKKTAPKAE